MSKILLIFTLLISSFISSAKEYTVGGQKIFIPAPVGFTTLKKGTGFYKKISKRNAGEFHEILDIFILESDNEKLKKKEPINISRHFTIKVNKSLAASGLTFKRFQNVKKVISDQNVSSIKDLKASAEKALKQQGKDINEKNVLEEALKNRFVVQFNVHQEEENLLSYSLYKKEKNPSGENYLKSRTGTTIFISGRMLLLVIDGGGKDLKWTRKASAKWTEKILKKEKTNK